MIEITKIERFQEVLVRVQPWEGICYLCGKIFKKSVNVLNHNRLWREHINIEHETKIFCTNACKLEWIYQKQASGVLMP